MLWAGKDPTTSSSRATTAFEVDSFIRLPVCYLCATLHFDVLYLGTARKFDVYSSIQAQGLLRNAPLEAGEKHGRNVQCFFLGGLDDVGRNRCWQCGWPSQLISNGTFFTLIPEIFPRSLSSSTH